MLEQSELTLSCASSHLLDLLKLTNNSKKLFGFFVKLSRTGKAQSFQNSDMHESGNAEAIISQVLVGKNDNSGRVKIRNCKISQYRVGKLLA